MNGLIYYVGIQLYKRGNAIISHMRKLLLMVLIFVSILLISDSESDMEEGPIIYGFWPDYIDPFSYQPESNALTHVAYHAWGVNSDGTLIAPADINRYNTVRDTAHQHKVKVIISISSSDCYTIDNILANHREDFANNVLGVLQEHEADGVNLDLEFPLPVNSVTQTSNVILFEEFAKTLYTVLKSANPDYHISIDTSSMVEYSYRNKNLSNHIDSIFLMGYDYNWKEELTGPNSPYNDPTRHDIKDSVHILLNYYDRQQIILGLPFYGCDWPAASDQMGTYITGPRTAVDMETAINGAQIYGRLWDSNSQTPWFRYQVDTVWRQTWYDDEESIGLKLNYARSENLGGIGFWALGWEGKHSNIWNTVRVYSGRPGSNPHALCDESHISSMPYLEALTLTFPII